PLVRAARASRHRPRRSRGLARGGDHRTAQGGACVLQCRARTRPRCQDDRRPAQAARRRRSGTASDGCRVRSRTQVPGAPVTALAALGARLRYAGLSPRALAAWVGSDRISALPALLGRVAGAPVTRASALLALFVAGDGVPIELVPHLDELHRHDLVAVTDGRARARVAILPLGPSLLVC